MSKQLFVANTILTAAQMNTLQTNDYNQTVSTKTANYVLVATDAGTKIVMNAAGATSITVNTSLFTAGDTLTFANIGAGVCTVTAGTATVSSAGSLAIAQYGGGTLYFTSAGVAIFFPSGVSAASAVVQVKSSLLTATFSGSAPQATGLDVTTLAVSITPTSASNKVLILCSLNLGKDADGQGVTAKLTGGNTATYRGDAALTRGRYAVGNDSSANGRVQTSVAMMYLDSPATTSATSYSVNINHTASGGTVTMYVNRSNIYDDVDYVGTYASTITAIEVTP